MRTVEVATAPPLLEPRRRARRAAAMGIAAGILSGLFGVGGGILLVPAFLFVVRLEPRRAAATSLTTVIPISSLGLVGYASDGLVDWPLGAMVGLAAVAGTAIGTRLLRTVPEQALVMALGILLLAVAVGMVLSTPSADGRAALDLGMAAAALAIGLFTGVLSGLFGVGGGFIIVPALVLLLSESPALAKGTSLLAILPATLMGTLVNTRARRVDFLTAAAAGVAGAVMAFATARLTLGIDPHLSNLLFAGLLVVVATQTLLRSRRMTPAS